MEIHIRPAVLPHDYPAISTVLIAENQEWPTTAEELARQDAQRDPALLWLRLVAEQTGARQLLGATTVGHDQEAHRGDKYLLDIRVRPEVQSQGIGAQLYAACLAQLAGRTPAKLYTEVWAARARAVRFVEARGFQEVLRRPCTTCPSSSRCSHIRLHTRLEAQSACTSPCANCPNFACFGPESLHKILTQPIRSCIVRVNKARG